MKNPGERADDDARSRPSRRSRGSPVRRRMLTDIRGLRDVCGRIEDLEVHYKPTTNPIISAVRLFVRSLWCDVTVLGRPDDVLAGLLCLLRLCFPFRKSRLVFFDMFFILPDETWRSRIKHHVRKVLWRSVDLFVSHVRDTQPLEVHFGIPASHARYVAAHVNDTNGLRRLETRARAEQVFSGGMSWRDYHTFCEAMRRLPYSGIIMTPPKEDRLHTATDFEESQIPDNVKVVCDDGRREHWVERLSAAEIVVICIRRQCIRACGVSNYLEAMALRKCVIITDCPASRFILEDGENALIVPAEEPRALAAAITRAMEDRELQERIAERGYEYAMSLGTELDLMERITHAALS